MTGRAWGVASILGQQHPDMHLVGFGLKIVEKPLHPVPLGFPGLAAAFPQRVAIKHPLLMLERQIFPRRVERDVCALGVFFQLLLALSVSRGLPWLDAALLDALVFIRNHQAKIDADHTAKPPA